MTVFTSRRINICIKTKNSNKRSAHLCSPGYMWVYEITRMWKTLPWPHRLTKRGFYKQTVEEWKPRRSVGLLVAFIEIHVYYFVNRYGILVSQMNTDIFHLSFPHSFRHITGFVTRDIRRVPQVEQDLLTFPEHLSFCITSGIRRVIIKRHEHHLIWKLCWSTVCINRYKSHK